jgi:hypothetical protein
LRKILGSLALTSAISTQPDARLKAGATHRGKERRSRLASIHFVARIRPIRANVASETLQQGIIFLGPARLLRELDEPFAEGCIKGSVLRAGNLTRLLDHILIGAKRNFLHVT